MSVISDLMLQRSMRKDARHLRLVTGGSTVERKAPSQFGPAIERLWARHDQMSQSGAFQKGAACVIGFAENDTVLMRDLLRQVGLGPCASCVPVDQLLDIALLDNGFRYLVVNIDAFEDCDAAVTTLLEFRQLRGDVVVVLVSSAVAMDDLGSERRLICDATLRAPVTLGRLQRGITAAFENNTAMSRDVVARRS
jgi:hypothetical protein